MPVIKEEKAQPELILTLAQHNTITKIKQLYYQPDCYKDTVEMISELQSQLVYKIART